MYVIMSFIIEDERSQPVTEIATINRIWSPTFNLGNTSLPPNDIMNFRRYVNFCSSAVLRTNPFCNANANSPETVSFYNSISSPLQMPPPIKCRPGACSLSCPHHPFPTSRSHLGHSALKSVHDFYSSLGDIKNDRGKERKAPVYTVH